MIRISVNRFLGELVVSLFKGSFVCMGEILSFFAVIDVIRGNIVIFASHGEVIDVIRRNIVIFASYVVIDVIRRNIVVFAHHGKVIDVIARSIMFPSWISTVCDK